MLWFFFRTEAIVFPVSTDRASWRRASGMATPSHSLPAGL
jgi:hypothetical protein